MIEPSFNSTRPDYYIDMHTGGALFNIYPLAGYMLHPDQAILDKQRNMAEAFGLPILWGTESTPEGRTISVARDAGVPAIYVEYAGGGMLNSKVISSYRKGVMQVLAHLDVTAPLRNSNILKPVYMVEDGTANSGYLQGKLPATGAGIFVSKKSPGDMLQHGEKIGTIVDPVSGKEMVVTADMKGLLLFIRTASLVKEGDALGGMLPITEPGKVTVNG